MINTESKFNELGVDAVSGVNLMEWLGISPIDLSDTARFLKFKDVIDYFKQFPPDTQRYLIKRAVNNKNVDKLNHVFEYSELLKNKRAVEEALEKLKVEGSALGPDSDRVLRMAHAQKEIGAKDALNAVMREIDIYEK
jgi:hypothetical protein